MDLKITGIKPPLKDKYTLEIHYDNTDIGYIDHEILNSKEETLLVIELVEYIGKRISEDGWNDYVDFDRDYNDNMDDYHEEIWKKFEPINPESFLQTYNDDYLFYPSIRHDSIIYHDKNGIQFKCEIINNERK